MPEQINMMLEVNTALPTLSQHGAEHTRIS
jgi:hypothetical protein